MLSLTGYDEADNVSNVPLISSPQKSILVPFCLSKTAASSDVRAQPFCTSKTTGDNDGQAGSLSNSTVTVCEQALFTTLPCVSSSLICTMAWSPGTIVDGTPETVTSILPTAVQLSSQFCCTLTASTTSDCDNVQGVFNVNVVGRSLHCGSIPSFTTTVALQVWMLPTLSVKV